nr:MAG TPA: hypothetical protein [Caudoviricetes sp.]
MINDTKKTPTAIGVFLHAILACFFSSKNEI